MWHALPILAASILSPLADSGLASHARPRLVLETNGALPGGVVTAALVWEMDPKWHIYYDGQNDSGQPPSFEADKLPAALTFGAFQWPAPERQALEGDIIDHIYAKKAVLLFPITVAKDAKPGEALKFEVPLRWMECATLCQLGEAKIAGTVRVLAKPADLKLGPDAKLFEAARKALPQPLPTDGSVKVEVVGDTLTITAKGADALTMMPASASTPLAHLASEAVAKGETLRAALKADGKSPVRVTGVLEVTKGKVVTHYAVDTRPETGGNKENPKKPEQGTPGSGTAPAK